MAENKEAPQPAETPMPPGEAPAAKPPKKGFLSKIFKKKDVLEI